MAVNIKENILTTIWREWVSTRGRMESAMKVNIITIRSMDTEYTHGQMVEFIKVCGSMESSMGLGITYSLITKQRQASGRMASELNGLTIRLFQLFSKAHLTSQNTLKRGLKVLKTWTTTNKEMI
jgi:hypothetical protein